MGAFNSIANVASSSLRTLLRFCFRRSQWHGPFDWLVYSLLYCALVYSFSSLQTHGSTRRATVAVLVYLLVRKRAESSFVEGATFLLAFVATIFSGYILMIHNNSPILFLGFENILDYEAWVLYRAFYRGEVRTDRMKHFGNLTLSKAAAMFLFLGMDITVPTLFAFYDTIAMNILNQHTMICDEKCDLFRCSNTNFLLVGLALFYNVSQILLIWALPHIALKIVAFIHIQSLSGFVSIMSQV
jgi:hypothetical protein